jgi:hypothetical protein
MADELSIALMAEENVIQGSGVAECVIDLARTTVLYGTAHVDNPLSISQELAAAQASKAFTLRKDRLASFEGMQSPQARAARCSTLSLQ